VKCYSCINDLIAKAKKHSDPQQGLAELRRAIDILPEAVTALGQGEPCCLYHFVSGVETFHSGIQKELSRERHDRG
jgi:hypothetical protein